MLKDTNKSAAEVSPETADASAKPTTPAQNTPEAASWIEDYLAVTSTRKPEKTPKETPEVEPAPPPVATPEPVVQPAPLDEEKLGRAIGESVAKSLKREEPVAPPEKQEPAVPKASQRTLDVYKHMEEMWPDKHKGLADKFVANVQRLKEYAAKWERDNPGAKFDENAEDHAEFKEKLESEIACDDDDFDDAKLDLRLKSVQPKAQDTAQIEALNERLQHFERQEQIKTKSADIAKVAAQTGNEFWSQLGDDYKTVVKKDGSINASALEAIKAQDEDVHRTLLQQAVVLEDLSVQNYLLHSGLVDYDPNNPAHRELSRFSLETEAAMLQKPKTEQLDKQGRHFVSRADYVKLTPEQREQAWTFSCEDMNSRMAADRARATRDFLKAEEEKFARRAKQRGLLKEPPTPEPQSRHPMAPDPFQSMKQALERLETNPKPESPSTPAVPRLSPNSGKMSAAAKSGLEGWIEDAIS